ADVSLLRFDRERAAPAIWLEEEWAASNRDPLDNANTIVESTGCSRRTITPHGGCLPACCGKSYRCRCRADSRRWRLAIKSTAGRRLDGKGVLGNRPQRVR